MAAATTGSPKTSPHRPNGLLEVTIIELAGIEGRRRLDAGSGFNLLTLGG